MNNHQVRTIQDMLTAMKNTAAELEQTIVDEDTRDFLLHSATNWLHDVEAFLLRQVLNADPANAAMWLDAADFQLRSANETLIHTWDLVLEYGPKLRVVGG